MNNKTGCLLVCLLGLLAWPLSTVGQSPDAPEPLNLEQAVRLGLQNNSLLKASELGVEAAQARVRAAWAGYLPKVSFDHTLTRGNNPVYVFGSLLTQRRFTEANFALTSLNVPSPLSNFQNKISLSQSLYDFGRTHNGVAQSRLGTKLSEKELEAARSDLIFRIVKAYHEAILAQEMVKVAESAVKSAIAAEESSQSRVEAGVALESDLLSIQVHRAAREEDLLKARNQLRLAQSALSFELGVSLDRQFALAQPSQPAPAESADLAALQAKALENRPDYQQSLLATQSQDLSVKASRNQFLPTLSLFASWETDDQSFASRAGNNWLAGVNFHINLFNGGADAARLAESRAQQRKASAMQEHMAQAVRLQVQRALLDLETANQRVKVNEQSVQQAEESLRIIRTRYDSGLATVTDLLRAETAVTAAKGNYLRALFDQRIGVADLERQVGSLSPDSRLIRE
ncbi:MAG: TolC family protein [Acidobacteriota bacterium]